MLVVPPTEVVPPPPLVPPPLPPLPPPLVLPPVAGGVVVGVWPPLLVLPPVTGGVVVGIVVWPPVTGGLVVGVVVWPPVTGGLVVGVVVWPPVAGWVVPPPDESQPWSKVIEPATSRATHPRTRACIAFRVLVRIASSIVSSVLRILANTRWDAQHDCAVAGKKQVAHAIAQTSRVLEHLPLPRAPVRSEAWGTCGNVGRQLCRVFRLG